ncbi:MAG TPA: RimK/LysX family protein [Candidatus Saccharimonadales bacterium]
MAIARKPALTIGSTEYISFPSFKLHKIPAKIDTGADSSAVWASNISVNGQELSYSLFGQGSAFYTEEIVKTDLYKVTKVKNSFGQEEFRYKVKLAIKVGDKSLISWFTLADRSKNTYPIILGKNFLRSRFVVDVSIKHALDKDESVNKVIVLSRQPKDNKDFFNKVSKSQTVNSKYINLGYESLLFSISSDHISICAYPGLGDIAISDLVYIKTHKTNADQAQAVADYLKFKAVRFIGKEINNNSAVGKLSEYMRLAVNRLPIPSSVAASSKTLSLNYDLLVEQLGSPFVLKDSNSDRGKNNFLISSKVDFLKILDEANPVRVYIAQQYIQSDGYYRLLVTGREVALAIKRASVSNKNPLKEHLNQPAGGANATLVKLDDIPADAKDLAIRAAMVMEREIAGVDILKDQKNNLWYILEANYDPQIRTGRFLDEKLRAVAKFLDSQLTS